MNSTRKSSHPLSGERVGRIISVLRILIILLLNLCVYLAARLVVSGVIG